MQRLNRMTLLMQQVTQTMMARCHLQLEGRRYEVAEKRIGFESNY